MLYLDVLHVWDPADVQGPGVLQLFGFRVAQR